MEMQLTHIIVESDAKSLIDQFSLENFEGNQRMDSLIKDISLFSSSLVACILYFQPRTRNNVAHSLAAWTKNHSDSCF